MVSLKDDTTAPKAKVRLDSPSGISPQKNMFDKIKPFLITAVVALIALGMFNRFAPMSLKKIVNG